MTTEQTETAETFNTSMADQLAAAAASLAVEDGYEPATGEGGEGEARTEAAAEPAPAEPEAADAAPPVEEVPAESPELSKFYAEIAERDRRIAELEAAPKPEPHAVAKALESRDPGAVLAALAQSGLSFDALAQHVIDNPDAPMPDAPAAPDPRDERIAKLEAMFAEQERAKQEAATQAAQQAQQTAVGAHLKSKADQFPIVADLGRADLVLTAMREAHGGAIPAFRTDAEAALAVEQAAKRVESALAEELAGYAKVPAIKEHLTKVLGLTAPSTAAPTRTGTRDDGSNVAPVFSNATAGQRASLGVDDDPDEDELERRAAAAMQAQLTRRTG